LNSFHSIPLLPRDLAFARFATALRQVHVHAERSPPTNNPTSNPDDSRHTLSHCVSGRDKRDILHDGKRNAEPCRAVPIGTHDGQSATIERLYDDQTL
jgi:hypothetical protein